MELVTLDSMNVSEYADFLDPDASEGIGREYFRGIVATDEESLPAGAMIWEYKDFDEDKETQAEIFFMRSRGEEDARLLLDEFDEQTTSVAVGRTFFELDELSDAMKKKLPLDGFKVTEGEGADLEVTVGDLVTVAGLKKKVAGNIFGLGELMDLQYMQGVTNCLFRGTKGIVEDLEFLEKEWFDQEISCCVITDQKVSGMLLVHRYPSGILMPMLLTAIGPDYKMDLVNMVVYSARKALEICPVDTRVVVRRHNESVAALANKLLGDKPGRHAFLGSRG